MFETNENNAENEAFENENYRIQYNTRDAEDTYLSYKVFDKKNNTNSVLRIDVKEECGNIDGECYLNFSEDGKEAVYMSALRPSEDRRKANAGKYEGEPNAGGHRQWHGKDSSYHYAKNMEDLMSIYRSLKKGDFRIDFQAAVHNRDIGIIQKHKLYSDLSEKKAEQSFSKEEASERVLKFMDSYIFNTDEARAVLAEYMRKYPLQLKEENTSENVSNKLAAARKRVARLADKVAGMTKTEKAVQKLTGGKKIEDVKISSESKAVERAVVKAVFDSKSNTK